VSCAALAGLKALTELSVFLQILCAARGQSSSRWIRSLEFICFIGVANPNPLHRRRVRAQMDLGVSNGLTVGAVMMVVQRDKVLALEAAGYSDLDTQRPMRTDAIFDIRSISKPITVFGALLLVHDGKLRLDDPLAKFLPEFSRVQVKGQTKPTGVPITIRQLMTHTSGIDAERPPELENITRTFDHTLA
jgi:CubicO group peptidase (beta-lactamase class C family)